MRGIAPCNWTGPSLKGGPGSGPHWSGNQPYFVMETTGRVASLAASFISSSFLKLLKLI